MTDPDAFARLLTDYCLEAQPGQQVLVSSNTLAAPLLLALQRELLEREAWPLLRVDLPGQAEGYWSAARDAHLDAFPSAELAEARADRRLAADPGHRQRQRAGGRGPGAADPRGPRAGAAAREACWRAAGRSRCGRRPPPPSSRG